MDVLATFYIVVTVACLCRHDWGWSESLVWPYAAYIRTNQKHKISDEPKEKSDGKDQASSS